MELLVLFDATTGEAGGFWVPKALQDLAKGWDTAAARPILEQAHADAIRVSVYLLDQVRLRRLCRDVSDAAGLGGALHRLSDRIGAGEGFDLRPSRPSVASGPLPLTAAIAALRDSTAESAALRALVIFSNGAEAGVSTIRNLADEAATSNVPVYPVALAHHLATLTRDGQVDRADLPFDEAFRQLGGLTGGHTFEAADAMSAPQMRDILEKVEAHALARARSQYFAGFVAAESEKPRDHRLEIRLALKSRGRVMAGKKKVKY